MENIVREQTEGENLADKLKFFSIYGLVSVTQFHIYHLLTDKAQVHEALKEFYETLQDELDEFIEYSIANFDLELDYDSDYDVNISFNYDEETVFSEVTAFRTITTNVMNSLQGNQYASLYHEVREIQEACDKLVYKLGLE